MYDKHNLFSIPFIELQFYKDVCTIHIQNGPVIVVRKMSFLGKRVFYNSAPSYKPSP